MVKKEEKKEFSEEAVRLGELVEYQEGAVVSRTIIDKGVGTVTLCAFDRGQGLSEHTVPYDAMVYIVEGEAEIKISGRPIRVRGGEMLVMPAGEPHALRAIERYKMLLIMIKSE